MKEYELGPDGQWPTEELEALWRQARQRSTPHRYGDPADHELSARMGLGCAPPQRVRGISS